MDGRSTATTLGDFLRARRGALEPHEVGLPDDGRPRRVPGLRREELAQLAHVSIDYIVRLEQGRARRVSRTVLDSLADALQLDQDGRDYMYRLADVLPPDTSRRGPARPRVAPRLKDLLDAMHDIPAMVLHRRMDVLAWNRAAAALLGDFGRLPVAQRNIIRMTFLDPAFRALYVEWPRVARECVAVLRMEAGRHPDDRNLSALVGELSVQDADFRVWWASHQVQGPHQLTKTFRHPVGGDLRLDVQQFAVDTELDQLLVTYTGHDAAARETLRFLLQVTDDADARTHRRAPLPSGDL